MDASKQGRLPPRRVNSDVAAGGVTSAVGVFFTVAALRIPSSTFANSVVQPRHLPIAIGVGLLLSGLALTVQGLLVGRSRGEQEVPESLAVDLPEDLEELPEPAERPRHLLVLGALLIAYLATFIPLGFIVATVLFLFAGGTYLEPRKLRRNVLFALIMSLVTYLLFDEVLGVVLPAGVLDFL